MKVQSDGKLTTKKKRDVAISTSRSAALTAEVSSTDTSSVVHGQRPKWPLYMHEAIGKIERQTRTLLEDCATRGEFLGLLLDISDVFEKMRSGAAESFKLRLSYEKSLPGFNRERIDKIAEETVIATLSLVPLSIRFSPRYREKAKAIQPNLKAELLEKAELALYPTTKTARTPVADDESKRSGRPIAEDSQRLHQAWIAKGKPPLNATTCDALASEFFPQEYTKIRGSARHKNLRDRIRAAIRRAERRNATKLVS